MNDDATTLWLIEDTTNEGYPTFAVNLSRNSSQDGDGSIWSLICSLTLDINRKFPTCFPISAIDNCVLMCKYSGVEFFFYDITNAFYDDVTNGGVLEYIHSLQTTPIVQYVFELIHSISIISVCPNMDSIHDIFK